MFAPLKLHVFVEPAEFEPVELVTKRLVGFAAPGAVSTELFNSSTTPAKKLEEAVELTSEPLKVNVVDWRVAGPDTFGANVSVATWSAVLRAARVAPVATSDGVSVVRSTVSRLPVAVPVVCGAMLEFAPSAVTSVGWAISNELVELSVTAPAEKLGRSPRKVRDVWLF